MKIRPMWFCRVVAFLVSVLLFASCATKPVLHSEIPGFYGSVPVPTGYDELVGIDLRPDFTYTLTHQVMNHDIFGKDEGTWTFQNGLVELATTVHGAADGPNFLPYYCAKLRVLRLRGRLVLQSETVPLISIPGGPLVLAKMEK